MVYLLLILIVYIIICLKPFYTISLRKNIIPILIILLMIGTICYSKDAVQATKSSMLLWVNNVVPALLPFFICIEVLKQSSILEKLSKIFTPIMYPLFGTPGCSAIAFLMGIISGYPVGAKVSVDLYEKGLCTKQEAEKMIAFTNSSGPLFVISAVGTGMFLNKKIGLLLLTTHILASILVGIILKNVHFHSKSSHIISQVSIKSNTSCEIHLSTLGKTMSIAIQNSLSTLLMILGYMVFFGIVCTVLKEAKLLLVAQNGLAHLLSFFKASSELSLGILTGFLEITGGIKEISSVATATLTEKIITTAFILGFGGLSVHMQVLSIISDAKLSIKPYLLGKLMQGFIASFYTFIIVNHTNLFLAQKTTLIQTTKWLIPFIIIIILIIHQTKRKEHP